MLILSNLVFLGGSQVGEIYWDRIFIQGKLLFSDNVLFSTFMQLVSHMGQDSLPCLWCVTYTNTSLGQSPGFSCGFSSPLF